MDSFRLDLQSPRVGERVFSIDVFRGLTMLVMIFVNVLDMSVIRNTPWWMKHATFTNPKPDFMTVADFIAPAFLFIVGASIPFAFHKRLERGASWWPLWSHILVRTASLMIIGIFMGNMRSADVLKTLDDPVIRPIGLTHASWSVLLLASFILVWNDYPRGQGRRAAAFVLLRLLGVGVLVWLAITYRNGKAPIVLPDLHPIVLTPTAWFLLLLAAIILLFSDLGKSRVVRIMARVAGIALAAWLIAGARRGLVPDAHRLAFTWYVIGVIGWSYLTACVVYFLFRRQLAGMVGCVAVLLALYMGDRAGVFSRFHFLDGPRHYLALGSIIGARGAITVLGLIVGMLFMEHSPAQTPNRRIVWILTLGVGSFAAGFLLRPLYGLSVPSASPTWVLYCGGYCCLAYAFLYWLTDVRGIRRWAGFTLPAGKNALLPYFLSFMFIPLLLTLRLKWVNDCLNEGVAGIVRTVGVSFLIGWLITAVLARLHVRLRL
jgi:heparan-alpha-glucosaminide N-acetyltransferase